ncbi:alpha/beta fold hydrolase [Gordonia pseudamarae]|jgi:pimeloyl-ACP methyl ester carboxylesterase|uniref:Alpha/beta fold hydrolase n=1 Tax=Gordonia pseudamarae TaxID=2831662 RepID=A0ABX6IIV5_9ACTN|nr:MULTISPECIES: alpha/beta hydrolase [Gordonia]MBD0020867.1 alpha/beta fold hydrolase [Gordonia sp. (in: high G+C Gram-positive bacteria)]QHN26266.1 alpha/beta fold hydrolase [Gordonia pseudamarae]QHN35158.1 alpha/beta fold hydrolase [Gordonia pseudamarae]
MPRFSPPRGALRLAAASLAAALTLAGCATGPDPGPDLVTGDDGGSGPASTSESATASLPALTAPASELSWTDCADSAVRTYGVRPATGTRIECAVLDSPIDPADQDAGTLTVSLTRVRSASTPTQAVPVVLTTGSDFPSTLGALLLATGPGRSLLDTNPVVAVDRRGLADSSAVDCLTRDERTAIFTNGQVGRARDTAARIETLTTAAASASDGCTEALDPTQLSYSIANAAADIDTLRRAWKVDRLALLGIGEGADVVLAYTADFGGRAGRIILDTPTAFGKPAKDRARLTAGGVQSALQTFAQRCAAADSCPMGGDPAGTLARVLADARAGRLGSLSEAQALSAITTALATSPSSSATTRQVATMVADAANGDVDTLAAAAERGATLRLSDGQLLARCNDATGTVGQNEVPALITRWADQYPLTGTDTAMSLLRCSGWGTAPTSNPPSDLPVVPVVLNTTDDPVNGGQGARELNATLLRAGVTPFAVRWDGLGYSTLANSTCAAALVTDYLGTTPLSGPTERDCPT